MRIAIHVRMVVMALRVASQENTVAPSVERFRYARNPYRLQLDQYEVEWNGKRLSSQRVKLLRPHSIYELIFEWLFETSRTHIEMTLTEGPILKPSTKP